MNEQARKTKTMESGKNAPKTKRKRSCWYQAYKSSCRALLLFALLITLTYAWLYYVGIPKQFVERVRNEIRKEGIALDFGNVYVRPFEGVVVEDLRWYMNRDDLVPTAEAEEVILSLTLGKLYAPERMLNGLHVRDARISTDLGQRAGLPSRQVFADKVNFDLFVREDAIVIEHIRAGFCEFAVRGRGEVIRKRNSVGAIDTGKSPPKIKLSAEEKAARRELRAQAQQDMYKEICRVVDMLSEANHRVAPEARLYFRVDENDHKHDEITLMVRSQGPSWIRGEQLDALRLDAHYKEQILHINRLQLMQDDRRLMFLGAYNTSNNFFSGTVENTLSARTLLALAPEEVKAELKKEELVLEGDINMKITFPGSSFNRAGFHFEGDFQGTEAFYKTIPVSRGKVHLKRDGKLIEITEIDALVGGEQHRGPLKGFYKEDGNTGKYRMNLETGFNPRAIVPLENRFLNRIIPILEFHGAPPVMDLFLDGTNGKSDSVIFQGKIRGADAVYKGVEFDDVSLDLEVLKEVLYITNLSMQREEGGITGELHNSFDKEVIFMDFISEIDPLALVDILGPVARNLVEDLSFEGPLRASVHGLYDYASNMKHSLHGQVLVKDMIYDRFKASEARVFWTYQNDLLTISDFNGVVNGGELRGFAQFTNLNSNSNKTYSLNLTLNNADLEKAALLDQRTAKNPYTGSLDGELQLAGMLDEKQMETMTGSGRVNVEKGQLFKTALFGGLSKYLSRLISGVGYTTQSDFSASFTVADKKVHSKDIYIKGNVFSVKGSGDIYFEKKLDCVFQVKLLKEGILAEAARLITWPITKLFEFRLKGDIENPEWRPQNLPKELFLRFD